MMASSNRRRGLVLVATMAIFYGISGSAFASAQSIASDGAVGVNASWEQGTSATWWVEEQRIGGDMIQSGIQDEDPNEIGQGITILNWGFAHQGADGSFPGTAGGSLGGSFQSVSLFLESVARATLLLKQYHPVTYSLRSDTYAAALARYTQGAHAAALWLMKPTVALAGQSGNTPYAHRRWLVAAALGQTATLTNDASIAAAATSYAQDGLALQLPAGWQAAITQNTDGSIPPATLLAPGVAAPPTTIRLVSACGVEPERNGYDVNYQCFGMLLAERYYTTCTDATLRAKIQLLVYQGLCWEMQFIDVQGNISTQGSSRVGIELNHDGTIKQVAHASISQGYLAALATSLDSRFVVVGTRIARCGLSISSTASNGNGACDINRNWEAGLGGSWCIGLQKTGVDYVQAGVEREDPQLIQTGLTILNWGFTQEHADGSFGSTSSPFIGVCQFVEAAARSILLLKQYHPVTYTLAPATYTSVLANYTAGVKAAALWLLQPNIVRMGQRSIANAPDRYYLAAAALSQTGNLTGNSSLAAAATSYVQSALPLQQTSGLNPDNGVYDVNCQALGILYAERCYLYCTDTTLQGQMRAMISQGLVWEEQCVNPDGTISGTASPASRSICKAYQMGYNLCKNTSFQVMMNRINTF